MATVKAALKPDTVLSAAIEVAQTAAEHQAGDFGVGEHLGFRMEGDRVLTHFFACPHPGYVGWHWAVTLTRPPRARTATVDEVVLLPGEGALPTPQWVPWSQRVRPGDVTPGSLLPTPDNDPRLEPGFTGGEMAADDDPAEWSETRAIVADLGLGRERVLSHEGRSEAAQRWIEGAAGPDNPSTEHAPAYCLTCGYFQRLSGSLGVEFGVCTNSFAPRDGKVVSVDHGCGGHSDVVADERGIELPEPVYDTISIEQPLFD
ncbi:DUF3027 domain-containing protein [Propionibacterium freudenreichii]|uniref:DUF3027 domain-containing protein n=1 Tax=Propionibacterium freudenreichii TaxID=1744 RepID=UPI0022B8D646|nr:DUF3027 domain-containing protein [Propionibacterium freudenreichii]WBF59302.1 DUF3027 domain-containing protein [Propionibacterium freudenreichii]WBF64229.1 DUF3027 domain-containing protein [Propionibacterium freudenreichii]